MIIKNLKKYFSFEVQVLDDKNVARRFRASNYQVHTVQIVPSLFFFSSSSFQPQHTRVTPFVLVAVGAGAVDNESEAVHMHDANAAGRRVEPDTVQPF